MSVGVDHSVLHPHVQYSISLVEDFDKGDGIDQTDWSIGGVDNTGTNPRGILNNSCYVNLVPKDCLNDLYEWGFIPESQNTFRMTCKKAQSVWILNAHRAEKRDKRTTDSSTWVNFAIKDFRTDYRHYTNSLWKIEPAGAPFEYYISLAKQDQHYDSIDQIGWYLCAHRSRPGDHRSKTATFVNIHKHQPSEPSTKPKWRIVSQADLVIYPLLNQIHHLTEENKTLSTRIQNLENSVAVLQAEQASQTSQIQDLSDAYIRLTDKHISDVTALIKAGDELAGELKEVFERLSGDVGALSKLHGTDIAALKQTTERLKNHVQSLVDTDISALHGKVSTLNSSVPNMAQNMRVLWHALERALEALELTPEDPVELKNVNSWDEEKQEKELKLLVKYKQHSNAANIPTGTIISDSETAHKINQAKDVLRHQYGLHDEARAKINAIILAFNELSQKICGILELVDNNA